MVSELTGGWAATENQPPAPTGTGLQQHLSGGQGPGYGTAGAPWPGLQPSSVAQSHLYYLTRSDRGACER